MIRQVSDTRELPWSGRRAPVRSHLSRNTWDEGAIVSMSEFPGRSESAAALHLAKISPGLGDFHHVLSGTAPFGLLLDRSIVCVRMGKKGPTAETAQKMMESRLQQLARHRTIPRDIIIAVLEANVDFLFENYQHCDLRSAIQPDDKVASANWDEFGHCLKGINVLLTMCHFASPLDRVDIVGAWERDPMGVRSLWHVLQDVIQEDGHSDSHWAHTATLRTAGAMCIFLDLSRFVTRAVKTASTVAAMQLAGMAQALPKEPTATEVRLAWGHGQVAYDTFVPNFHPVLRHVQDAISSQKYRNMTVSTPGKGCMSAKDLSQGRVAKKRRVSRPGALDLEPIDPINLLLEDAMVSAVESDDDDFGAADAAPAPVLVHEGKRVCFHHLRGMCTFGKAACNFEHMDKNTKEFKEMAAALAAHTKRWPTVSRKRGGKE